jgi:hypothetical protein
VLVGDQVVYLFYRISVEGWLLISGLFLHLVYFELASSLLRESPVCVSRCSVAWQRYTGTSQRLGIKPVDLRLGSGWPRNGRLLFFVVKCWLDRKTNESRRNLTYEDVVPWEHLISCQQSFRRDSMRLAAVKFPQSRTTSLSEYYIDFSSGLRVTTIS